MGMSPSSGSPAAPVPINAGIGNYLKSKIESPATKSRKLDVEMLKATTAQTEAETKAKQSEAMLAMAKSFMDVVSKHLQKDT